MFNNYKIDNNVLYLYVDDKCEIGSLFNIEKKENITKKIRKYINDHKIKFNGTKVVLLLSGLMLGTVYLNNDLKTDNYETNKDYKYVYNVVDKNVPEVNLKENNEELIEEMSKEEKEKQEVVLENNENKGNNSIEKKVTSNINSNILNNTISNNIESNTLDKNESKDNVITIMRTSGEVIQMNLEDYLVGVVSAEIPASFNIEALKAQAIVARTYTLKLLESNRTITDDVKTQVYKNNDELKTMWGSSYDKYYQKVKTAVEQTKGLCIKYNGSLIDAVYHSTSNGYTEDSVYVWGNEIPYLKMVTSPWDTSSSTFLRSNDISFQRISEMLGIPFDASSSVEIIKRDESNRILKIKFNGNEYSGVEIRNKLGLRSTDFDVVIKDGFINFVTRGYGHGVGMSQYGANGMANSGYSYEQIIKHYYTNVEIVKV